MTKTRALTSREKQILQGVRRCQTNAQIAYDLGLSYETVKTYINRLRAKLGVSSKMELAVFAAQNTR